RHAKIAMREAKAAAAVKRLHGKNPVHADGGAGPQAGLQRVASPYPEITPDAGAAQIRTDDEKAHEPERAAVGNDGAGRDELTVSLRADKAARIGRPENIGVVQTGVPTFGRRPCDGRVKL